VSQSTAKRPLTELQKNTKKSVIEFLLLFKI